MRNDPVISEAEHQQFRCLHRLEELHNDPDKFRFRCIECGKFMYRKNGVLVKGKAFDEWSAAQQQLFLRAIGL